MQDKRLIRIATALLGLRSNTPFPVRIFANDQVSIEPVAVDELLSVLSSHMTLDRLRSLSREFQDVDWAIEQAAVTTIRDLACNGLHCGVTRNLSGVADDRFALANTPAGETTRSSPVSLTGR